jgi:hypothetical protein
MEKIVCRKIAIEAYFLPIYLPVNCPFFTVNLLTTYPYMRNEYPYLGTTLPISGKGYFATSNTKDFKKAPAVLPVISRKTVYSILESKTKNNRISPIANSKKALCSPPY